MKNMRKNKQDPRQPNGSKQSPDKVHGGTMSGGQTSLRVTVAMLALLLMTISGLGPFVKVNNVYAKSTCGVLILCPTPTSGSTPKPTPTPDSIPTPTPLPTFNPTPTPTLDLAPTPILNATTTPYATPHPVSSPTASVSHTVIARGAMQTPDSTPTSVAMTRKENTGNQTPNQLGGSGSGFSPTIVFIAIIFLCLLLILGIGLFIFRHMLLPPINAKLPPSGVSSWLPSSPISPPSNTGVFPSDSEVFSMMPTNNSFEPDTPFVTSSDDTPGQPEIFGISGNSLLFTAPYYPKSSDTNNNKGFS